MTIVKSLERFFGTKSFGRYGVPYQFGQRRYALFRYGREEPEFDNTVDTPLKRFGIYQRRTRYGKQIVVRERFYHPYNPQTVTQQAHRTTFADGMAGWASLTPTEKAEYNKNAEIYKLHGVNLYMREWLRSH